MNNLGFLNKQELSYILNNRSVFGFRMLEQVENYCGGIEKSEKIKALSPEWNELSNRLSLEIENNAITIYKTDNAKQAEKNGILFVLISISIIIIGTIWVLSTKSVAKFEDYYALMMIPFLSYLVYNLVRQKNIITKKSKTIRLLKILHDSKIQLYENGNVILKDEIKTVNLFWLDDGESGSLPRTSLVLKLINRKTVVVDNDGYYIELFSHGNKIAKFLNCRFNILHGSNPIKLTLEL